MSSGLRVLMVTNTFPTAETPGSTPCIKDQLSALREKGIKIELLYIDHTRKLNYAKAALRLFLLSFQKKRYDLIHAYYGHSGLLARLQFRYPIVTTFLGSDLLSRRDGIIGRLVAKLVKGVIVMTEEMKLVAKRDDAYIIPFGVNLDIFTPSSMERARRDLGLPLSDKFVLFPWNPARTEKRFDVVKGAIQILQKEQENVRLVVVYNKPREVVVKYMNACDAMVLASDHEGAPMAVREALACNLPIVSVDVGDVRQVIGGVEGCYLCERDPEDIAEKLGWVLNRGRRTNGSQVIRKMDAAWAAEQVISVYNFVLNKSRVRS